MTDQNYAPPQVAGIGELLWDMLPQGRRIGGAPANFAYHVNALGVPTTVVSCIGRDALGDEILRSVSAWKMNPKYIRSLQNHPTGTVEVQLDEKGSPLYNILEGVAWDRLAWNDDLASLAPSLRAVCFGSLGQRSPASRSTIQQFLKMTSPQCIRVFDVNLRQRYFNAEVLRESLELATVLKLNHEEAPVITSLFGVTGSLESSLRAIRDLFQLELIALTKGGEGSSILTKDGFFEHPGFPTKPVDTVGAGDSFTAALVVGMLRGDDPETLNIDANRKAASVCGHSGAIPE